MLIQFYVRQEGKEAVEISIQGTKNKLSGENAPYPNQNKKFTYLLSVGADTEKLEVWMSSGNYSIDNMAVYTADEKLLKDREIIKVKKQIISKKGRGGSKNYKKNNVYSGEIEMPTDGYFMTTFPYRSGYQIQVDGENINPQKINTIFVGIPIKKGSHEICINFTAPGYRLGTVISIVAWILFVCHMLTNMKTKNKIDSKNNINSKNGI